MVLPLLTNVSSSRRRPPPPLPSSSSSSSARRREEGWTEVWGCSSSTAKPSSPSRHVVVLDDDCDVISADVISAETPPPPPSPSTSSTTKTRTTILTQHRVAWHEQIIMRMMDVPHDVINSGYRAMNSTGSLPHLLDVVPSSSSSSSSSDDHRHVLVGRDQPGGMGCRFLLEGTMMREEEEKDDDDDGSTFVYSGSHVVDYLLLSERGGRCVRPGDVILSGGVPDSSTTSTSTSSDAVAYEAMILDSLNVVSMALRYGNDDAAWGGTTFRPRRGGVRSSSPPLFPTMWSWCEARKERSSALRGLLSSAGGPARELFLHGDDVREGVVDGVAVDDDDDKGKVDGRGEEDDASHRRKRPSSSRPWRSRVGADSGGDGGESGRVDVRRAMELADRYYGSLERRLLAASSAPEEEEEEEEEGRRRYHLLGTIGPTRVDALLFAHLAEARNDVHLARVLSCRPVLTRYFDGMRDAYFGGGYADGWRMRNPGMDDGWIRRNDVANSLNPFNDGIPEKIAPPHTMDDDDDGRTPGPCTAGPTTLTTNAARLVRWTWPSSGVGAAIAVALVGYGIWNVK